MTVPADTRPMVEARAVHKAYGRLEVLKGIDITVGRGEVLCLIGPSGSGKSTFLRCINHLEKIDGGELCVDGELVGAIIAYEVGRSAGRSIVKPDAECVAGCIP